MPLDAPLHASSRELIQWEPTEYTACSDGVAWACGMAPQVTRPAPPGERPRRQGAEGGLAVRHPRYTPSHFCQIFSGSLIR